MLPFRKDDLTAELDQNGTKLLFGGNRFRGMRFVTLPSHRNKESPGPVLRDTDTVYRL